MKGLIKKDLIVLARNSKVILILFALCAFFAILGNDNFIYIFSMLGASLMVSTFAYDEQMQWDAYAITMPNARKNVVKSKYITTLILILTGMVVSFILVVISLIIKKNTFSILESMMVILGMGSGALIMPIVMYPLFYRFGVEKSRMSLFIIFLLLVAILGMIPNNTIDTTKTTIDPSIMPALAYVILSLPIVLIIGLFVSYKISEFIYMRKEF